MSFLVFLSETSQWKDSCHLVSPKGALPEFVALTSRVQKSIRTTISVESTHGKILHALPYPFGWAEILRSVIVELLCCFSRKIVKGLNQSTHSFHSAVPNLVWQRKRKDALLEICANKPANFSWVINPFASQCISVQYPNPFTALEQF